MSETAVAQPKLAATAAKKEDTSDDYEEDSDDSDSDDEVKEAPSKKPAAIAKTKTGYAKYAKWSASLIEDETRRRLNAAELQAKNTKLRLLMNYRPPTTNFEALIDDNFTGQDQSRASRIAMVTGSHDYQRVLGFSSLCGNDMLHTAGSDASTSAWFEFLKLFDVLFRNQLLVFQQHQDESLYDSWTRFKDIIRKVPNHGLSIWTLIEIFLKHLDSLSCHIIHLTAEGDLRKFSDIGAWYAIEDCVQYDKRCSNPTSSISDETIANPNAQIVEDDMVRVQVPRCMAWLNYDEHVDSLSTMDNEVGVTSPESTIQNLPSFEEYTPPVTYPEEVEKTLGTPIEPQPEPLPNCPPLDASLGTERGLKPPIKPQSPDSFRIKEVDHLTNHTLPSPHVASFHHKDTYCYYHPCIGDPKKHYGFKPGLLGQGGSLGVDLLNWEMIEDDWQLEPKEVSFLGRGLNLPVRPKELENVRTKETHHSKHIIQQPIFQHVTPSHNDGVYRYYHPHLNSSVEDPSSLSVK
ncbi:hypothetical protein Tco_1081111 [Tanacetum coccineum]|uniref:Uncharacterized protein n=1 Tax=Tanacetum coccineum TaxID=301880 RepID=A0ABQ5HWM2_9ASTR